MRCRQESAQGDNRTLSRNEPRFSRALNNSTRFDPFLTSLNMGSLQTTFVVMPGTPDTITNKIRLLAGCTDTETSARLFHGYKSLFSLENLPFLAGRQPHKDARHAHDAKTPASNKIQILDGRSPSNTGHLDCVAVKKTLNPKLSIFGGRNGIRDTQQGAAT